MDKEIPEGLVPYMAVSADTGGRTPVAWVDAGGNLMPVEVAPTYPVLPDGARYIYDRDEVLQMANRLVYAPASAFSKIEAVSESNTTVRAPMRESVVRPAALAVFGTRG